MKTGLVFLLFLASLALLGPILGPFAAAQSAPAPEKQKIEALIKRVGELEDASFVRNGSTYGLTTAVRFLRGKWRANDAKVRTARDFIDTVASVSSTSGKPYLIRFQDGREINSRDFLVAELTKLEANLQTRENNEKSKLPTR